MKHIIYSFIVVFALFLTSCADAGKDQTVNSGALVTLDASNSTASVGGEIKKYIWQQIRGPHVSLSNTLVMDPTFIAPTVTEDTNLIFILRTVEYGGKPSRLHSLDYVKILVQATDEETDTTPPVITLNGDENMTLNVGDSYEELGANAIDDVDGNIEVAISGTVNTAEEGDYVVTYTATDAAENVATKTRQIHVLLPLDTEAPTLTLLGDSVVTIYQDTVYVDAGAEANDTRDGNITNNIEINNSVDTSKLGIYTVTYNVKDAAGNAATAITRTVHVVLPPDTEAPIITLVGDANITVYQYTSYIDEGVTVTDNRDTNITAHVNTTVNTKVLGTTTLIYTAIDEANNSAIPVSRTVHVVLPPDTQAPTITLNGADTVTFNIGDTYIEYGAQADDNRDGNITENIVIDISNLDMNHTGTYYITYNVTDAAGLDAIEVVRTVVVKEVVSSNSITGTITNIAGERLKGVRVFSTTNETYTDINGTYTLETNGSNMISIVTEFENYMENSKVVTMDINSTQNFTLINIDKIETFDAEVGKEILTKGAKINFPASAVVNEDGSAYTGIVTTNVSYNRVTSVTGQAAFPGNYIGQTIEGNTTILRSYGFIDVTMEDNASNALKIADGSSVTLTFPMDPNIQETPATIPLWYYDTEKGIWVEDGEATYDETTNSYSGDVTHFTTWNLDAKMNQGSLEGCVEDSNGNIVTNALIKIEGAGWGSGLKDNTGNTFNFINAPTGMPMSLTAYTSEGTSQTETITLAANENRVMSKCLIIDPTNLSPYITLKARIVNENGDILTNHIYGSINNTLTGNQIKYISGYNGQVNILFERPSNNKINLSLTLNGLSINETYTLDPNSNILDIGDVIFDMIKIKGRLINESGTPVDNAIIFIKNSDNTIYLASSGATSQSDGTFISNYFMHPSNNSVIVSINTGIKNIDINTTLIGSITDIGDIVIPGVSVSGRLLDANGNPLSLTNYNSIYIYDTSTTPPTYIGSGSINSDGTFTTPYFDLPSNGQIKIDFNINGNTISKIITLDDNNTLDIGDITTSLSNITGLLTDMNGTATSASRITIIDTDTNNTLLTSSVNTEGIINSTYFPIPTSGNISIRFYKSSFNDIYAQRDFYITKDTTDIGTIALAVANFKAKLLYADGTPLPKYNTRGYIYDTATTTYNSFYGSSITSDNGDIDFGDFFKPNNNQIKLVVPFTGNDFIQTIDLNETNRSTNLDINIDAITVTGTIINPNSIDNVNNTLYVYIYAPTIDSSYYSGAGAYTNFVFGPILRPHTNNLDLSVYSSEISGDSMTLPTITLETDIHNTNIGEQNLTFSKLQSCINIPANVTLDSLSVRTTPFSYNNIDTYTTYAYSDKDNGTFGATFWQNDINQTLYIFATDSQGNDLIGTTTFIPNQPLIDLTDNCQSLTIESTTEKAITVTQENSPIGNTITLQYMQRYPRYQGELIDTIDSSTDILTFSTTKNGIYRIRQLTDSAIYGGIFKITIDGVTTTLTVPMQHVDYAIGWNLFDIEIYEGDINLVERNYLEQYEAN